MLVLPATFPVLPPLAAALCRRYSPSGDVTAPLVYANYGRPEDFDALEAAGVSVDGTIVITRYGESTREARHLLERIRSSLEEIRSSLRSNRPREKKCEKIEVIVSVCSIRRERRPKVTVSKEIQGKREGIVCILPPTERAYSYRSAAVRQ